MKNLEADKKYTVLYADPPWSYDFSRASNRIIENHYPTLTVEQICKIDVPKICRRDAVLYLWATAPKLIESLSVMSAWGFQYKTNAVWDKEKLGMGYWFRGQHELLLVGTRGKMHPPEPVKRAPSVYRERRGRHSAKPMYFRVLIHAMFPTVSKIELFSRYQATPEWDVWGYEVINSVMV